MLTLDTESLKYLHALFDTYLDHMHAKFEPNCIVGNVQNLELFWQKIEFLKNIFDKSADAILKAFSVAEASV